jgi:predicted nucleotidyltransferase
MHLQCVKNKDIKKIYSPRDYFRILNSKKSLTEVEKMSKSLCDVFINLGNVPDNMIGITGSPMINLNTKKSDIDLIIYGTKTSLEFQEKILALFKNNINKIRKYNLEEYKIHYKWRVGGSDISFQDFLRTEQRKNHQGKFQGIDFFIRYIKDPKDWGGSYYDYLYKNLGRISLIAKVTDSTESIFTPCTYKINCEKILKSNFNLINRMKDIIQINSYRGRFCEQAKNGEKVRVDGKIEMVRYKDSEFYRILLTDQIMDKMIIIS